MVAFDKPPLLDNLFGVLFMVFSVIEDGQYPQTPNFCHPLDYFDYCRSFFHHDQMFIESTKK